jgi:hypothetical protein
MVDLGGEAVTVVWLRAAFVGLDPQAATTNITLATAIQRWKPARISGRLRTMANYVSRQSCAGCGLSGIEESTSSTSSPPTSPSPPDSQ